MSKNKSVLQKMMPHSIEAEQSVLGSVLIDEEASINILGMLKHSDFYLEAHKIIFESMHNVFYKSLPIDFVTLTDELETNNLLDSVGGVEYLTFLTNFVPSASNYSHYADIVKRNSILRQLISASNKIAETSYDSGDAQEALSAAEKLIFDISQTQSKTDLEHVKTALVDVIEKFESIQKNPNAMRGLRTGFYGLDKILNGLNKSDLILLAARPGFGKTSLAMNLVTNTAIKSNAKVAIFSLEMPKVQLAQRALCSVAFVSMEKALKGDLNTDEWKRLLAANEKLSGAEIFVDDSSLNTPVEILSKCRRIKAEKGLDFIVIDYLQLMSSGGRNKENRQQEVSEISRSLKILAKELDVPVLVLSQLSRAVESRAGHKPVLSDLRESGAIEQDADIVMFIHRKDMYEDTAEKLAQSNSAVNSEIIIAKHRNGSLGEVPVRWVGELTTFINATGDSNEESLVKTFTQRQPAQNQQKKDNLSAGEDFGSDIPLPTEEPGAPAVNQEDIAPISETDLADFF